MAGSQEHFLNEDIWDLAIRLLDFSNLCITGRHGLVSAPAARPLVLKLEA